MYLAATAAIVGFALVVAMCDFGQWPRILYWPYRRSWSVGVPGPEQIVIGYWGTWLWGASGALVLAVVVWLASGWWRRSVSDPVLRLAGAWAITAVGLSAGYYLWNLWPF
jgi:hypothetical protein